VKLLLNTKPYLHQTSLETWGQWLEVLDRDGSRTGTIVTGVRFDGVDEPAFRAPNIRGRRLDEWRMVEVETGTERDLLLGTLKQGAGMVASLADAAGSVGEAFRQANLAEAHAMLPQLIDSVRSVVGLTDECAAALKIPRAAMLCQSVPFDRWMGEFGRRLAVLLDAQGREDWLTVADSLEYEIAPALREWGDTFEQLALVAGGPS
jgi:hypothetical protein